MITIKIISNPYKKEVQFQYYKEGSGWVDINYLNHPNSKLLQKTFTEGFFPFYVEKIVETICSEFGIPDESITIIFKGPSDEYEELEHVCQEFPFDYQVIPQRDELGLENGRDVLPKVVELFQEMSPLILKSVNREDIQNDLLRFEDASNDVVPICVLGNYSAGKSTFINALIGHEILPSGSEPVTAKVYKIARSNDSEKAVVRYKYYGQNMQITFTKEETAIDAAAEDTSLPEELKKAIDEVEGQDLAVRIKTVIGIVNSYEDNTEGEQISDLIELEVPFAYGVLAETKHPFVIFDTPGSNSVSNVKHLLVLKEAMANMTNGLPIFLSTPDTLDSMDNDNLYQVIREYDELDGRFTLIVVNKADSAGLQRKSTTSSEQEKVLNQAVPRNLYSGGIFYVSSILGLGAKTNGEFSDYVYEDIFDAQEARYNNPDHKHYRSLYLFNIMPAQMKKRADELAAGQKELIYANSGLFSIEEEIETFAGRYAPYNKCLQSQLFLGRVIKITKQVLSDEKRKQEELRQNIYEKLEEEKKSLTDKLQNEAGRAKNQYINEYQGFMKGVLEQTQNQSSETIWKEKYDQYIKELKIKHGYAEASQSLASAKEGLGANLKDSFQRIIKDSNGFVSGIKKMTAGFVADVATITEKSKTEKQVIDRVKSEAKDNLVEYAKLLFKQILSDNNNFIDAESRTYWTQHSELIRNLLASVVSGSDVLTDERRQELKKIIITYQQVSFKENAAEDIFKRGEFTSKLRLFNTVIWESDTPKYSKIASVFNENMTKEVNIQMGKIKTSHKKSAENWLQCLLDEINSNLVKYNPELSRQAEKIKSITLEIQELVNRQEKLEEYTEELNAMMTWKPA